MKNLNLNPKERLVIAEFIFGEQVGILIKSDGTDLINLFFKHKIIVLQEKKELTNAVNHQLIGISVKLITLLRQNIPLIQREAIMNEYYGRQKYEIQN